MPAVKCKYCGETQYMPSDRYDNSGFCQQHNHFHNLDRKKVEKGIRDIVYILKTQDRYKEFEPILQKMCKSYKGAIMFASWPKMELLFDLELHLRGWKHQHQTTMGPYRVDFYIKELGLVIEIDEKYHTHSENWILDKAREEEIKQWRNVYFLRIPEQLLRANIKDAADKVIVSVINKHWRLGRGPIKEKLKQMGYNWEGEHFWYKGRYII